MAKNLTIFPEPPLTDNDALVMAKPRNLRDAMETVFESLGGHQGMIEWVQANTANKRIFYKDILPKLIPKEVNVGGQDTNPVKLEISWGGGGKDPALEHLQDE